MEKMARQAKLATAGYMAASMADVTAKMTRAVR